MCLILSLPETPDFQLRARRFSKEMADFQKKMFHLNEQINLMQNALSGVIDEEDARDI
jgi:hypothetical protein